MNPNIKGIIHRNWNIISNSPDCGPIFLDKPLIGFGTLPNLREYLTNATTSYPPVIVQKSTPHSPIYKLDIVKCNFTKKSFKPQDLPKHVTCELSNVIYLITCTKCHMQNVGETCRVLRKRMYEHKSSVLKDGLSTPVSRHFKNDGHSHKHMQFSVLECCTPKFESDSTSKRRRTELCWIFKLHSLAPTGINPFVPICVKIYGYYPDCIALSSHPSLFLGIRNTIFEKSLAIDCIN